MKRHGMTRRLGLLSLLTVSALGCDSSTSILALGSTPVSLAITVPSASGGASSQPRTLQLAVGGTVSLSATAFDAIGQPVGSATVQWASSEPGVATITAQGVVLAVGAGTTEVSATASGVVGLLSVVVIQPN